MKKIRNTVMNLLVAFILTACTSTVKPAIQFREYDFPEYEQTKINQNGVELYLGGIYAIDRRTVFLFGNLGVANGIGHRSLLLRSTDGGQHWQEVNIKQETNSTVMIVTFVSNGIGWALSTHDVEEFSAGNLYRSSDFGETWGDPIAIGGYEFHPWGMKFTDKNNGYIKFDWVFNGLDDHMGILSTADGGMTWRETFSTPISMPKDKDAAKYKQIIEQAQAELKEPTGGDYGSYWDNYWDTEKDWRTCNTKGHDGSEWNLYYYKPSAEYIVLMRPASITSWEAVATIRTKYEYTNGQVANP